MLADTHLRGGIETLEGPLLWAIEAADVVLHAGDVVSPAALAGLQSAAQTHAVLGNNDHELVGLLPDTLLLELAGVRVALVHDSGPRVGRPARLHRRFPDAQLVVFGHSHDPVDQTGVKGQLLFNPGSPTQRRRQPHRTFGRLRLSAGRVRQRRIEVLP